MNGNFIIGQVFQNILFTSYRMGYGKGKINSDKIKAKRGENYKIRKIPQNIDSTKMQSSKKFQNIFKVLSKFLGPREFRSLL